MHEGRLVFAQLMDYFPKREFQQCVERYRGNYRLRQFSCRDQFLAMTFGQLTYRASLRDIETCLRAMRRQALPCRLSRHRRPQYLGPGATNSAIGESITISHKC